MLPAPARPRPSSPRSPAHPFIYPCVLSSPKRLRARSLGGSVGHREDERGLSGGRHRRRANSHASTAVSVATATAATMLRTEQKKEKSSFNSPRITLCSAGRERRRTAASAVRRSSSGAVVERDNKHRVSERTLPPKVSGRPAQSDRNNRCPPEGRKEGKSATAEAEAL